MLFQASDAADMEVEDSGEQHVTLQLNPASSDGPVSVGLAVVTADKVGHAGPQPIMHARMKRLVIAMTAFCINGQAYRQRLCLLRCCMGGHAKCAPWLCLGEALMLRA